jgi:hypothetical protein
VELVACVMYLSSLQLCGLLNELINVALATQHTEYKRESFHLKTLLINIFADLLCMISQEKTSKHKPIANRLRFTFVFFESSCFKLE